MCGQKLTTNWVPSVVDYHTGCYRVGCRHCGWATYLTSATEEQAIDSAKEFMAKIFTIAYLSYLIGRRDAGKNEKRKK